MVKESGCHWISGNGGVSGLAILMANEYGAIVVEPLQPVGP